MNIREFVNSPTSRDQEVNSSYVSCATQSRSRPGLLTYCRVAPHRSRSTRGREGRTCTEREHAREDAYGRVFARLDENS